MQKLVGLVVMLSVVPVGSTRAQDAPGDLAPSIRPALSRLLANDDPNEDGRRTVAALPRNLGRSFIGVFSKQNLPQLLLGAAATGTGSLFDRRAHDSLIGQAPGFSHTASSVGSFAVVAPATAALFVAGRLSHDTRLRGFSYDAAQALIVNGIYTEVFKKAVRRVRPDGSDALSFPSGHASSAFALATVAEKHYGFKVAAPAYVAASAIGFSRISNNKHYLGDVLAGATLGVITGRTVVRVNGDPIARHREISFAPMQDAQGTGVGLGAQVRW